MRAAEEPEVFGDSCRSGVLEMASHLSTGRVGRGLHARVGQWAFLSCLAVKYGDALGCGGPDLIPWPSQNFSELLAVF